MRIPEGLNKRALLNYLSKALDFPSYFGENWDALYDCLSSMPLSSTFWIAELRVVLIHEAFPDLDDANLNVYLSILNDVTELKKQHTHSRLVAIFPHFKKREGEVKETR